MIKHSYARATLISFFIHGALLWTLFISGYTMFSPVSNATPIEVEVIPAKVIDTGHNLAEFNPPALDSGVATNQSVVATSEQLQKQAFPHNNNSQAQQSSLPSAQGNDTAVVQATVTGLGVAAPISTNSGNSGKRDMEETDGGQEAKPVVRTKASRLSGARPAYPYDARHAGWEGTVVVRILVSVDGPPAAVSVRTSSGHSVLDEAAVESIKNWRFSAARQGEKSIESYYDVRVKFNLADAEVHM